MKRYLFKCHFLPVFTTAPLSSSFWLLQECCHVTHYQWILARSIWTVTVAFCKKLQQKTHHIHQFENVYGMRTIITIVKADYCFMSQLLLNILSDVTLPPFPSFFVHFKHTFVTHPTKIFRFSIAVTPPPRDTACNPPPKKKILNVHLSTVVKNILGAIMPPALSCQIELNQVSISSLAL